jgi:IS30 family transposase
MMRSITWDQRTEIGRHPTITWLPGAPVFFCDPDVPWQRGSNEI